MSFSTLLSFGQTSASGQVVATIPFVETQSSLEELNNCYEWGQTLGTIAQPRRHYLCSQRRRVCENIANHVLGPWRATTTRSAECFAECMSGLNSAHAEPCVSEVAYCENVAVDAYNQCNASGRPASECIDLFQETRDDCLERSRDLLFFEAISESDPESTPIDSSSETGSPQI